MAIAAATPAPAAGSSSRVLPTAATFKTRRRSSRRRWTPELTVHIRQTRRAVYEVWECPADPDQPSRCVASLEKADARSRALALKALHPERRYLIVSAAGRIVANFPPTRVDLPLSALAAVICQEVNTATA